MALIKTATPENASDEIKEQYSIFEPLGFVPAPFQLFSASPFLLDLRKQGIIYGMDHPTLSAGLTALIRLLIADDQDYYYCISANKQILSMFGFADEDEAAKAVADPASAPLNEKDKAMLLFVLKAVRTPDEVQQEDVDHLRRLGWSDQDIFEATAHGAGMVSDGILFKAFKMKEGMAC
ncbi:carboxymuconolactone decarboxylase family protein [Dethiosulfatarculus sandiegensis]|uniref:Carboxymuconolactone decarboxylase-like domain-containing protein n=1 Tax=Dethiosulfatarculus sandiegensis TaxID=1429043 RepID=A0A0D2JVV8_9BACT|nr:hypothetical protein [Dethiosulfatarculus sandiegensis]KIX13745.1 hypothetical protein X474_12485 [Dethiosulfatarculus sandiegensis]